MIKKVQKTDKKPKAAWNKESQKLKIGRDSMHGREKWARGFIQKLIFLLSFGVFVFLVVLLIQLYQSWEVSPKIVEAHQMPELDITGNSSVPSSIIRQTVLNVVEPGLATVNPFEVKQSLEALGQILTAEVEKDFPNTLKIHVVERLPILLMATSDNGIDHEFWTIDETGVVFKPSDFNRIKALNLPWIRGLKIEKVEDQVTQVPGIERVNYLLQLLKSEAWAVFNDILSVDMVEFGEGEAELGAVIILRGKQLKKIVFSVENFEYQVVKLIGVLSVSGKVRLSDKNVIDLSYSGDAIVR